MLKHVHISPLRSRSDSTSLRASTASSLNNVSYASSLCSSPEPQMTLSRSSSYSSLNESTAQTTLKVYTACLKLDIEYKTLAVSWDTTARQIVTQVLRRCKIRHRDPRLFYLSMEVRIRRSDARTLLTLDDTARPAMLQACHPSGESKFHLQMKSGGLIRVHTSALQQTSQYKSLLISEQTTSDELLSLLISCYNLNEPVEDFSLYEVCPDQEYQRKLHPDDLPLRAQIQRNQKGENCHFLVRRTKTSARRSFQLENRSNIHQQQPTPISPEKSPIATPSIVKSTFTKLESCFGKINALATRYDLTSISSLNKNLVQQSGKCQCNIHSNQKCKLYNQTLTKSLHDTLMQTESSVNSVQTYSPVYNIREIRTVQNSFSSFGSDKKLIDLDMTSRKAISRRHSVAIEDINNYVYI